MSRNSTALILFTQSPEVSAQSKSWLNSVESNYKLHSRVYERMKKIAEEANTSLYIIDEHDQYGHGFQERLWNAIDGVFRKGYDAVLTMGGDTPTLNSEILSKALTQLALGKNVLGPSMDGGTYLLGFQKDSFDHIRSHTIEWFSGVDFTQIKSLLSQDNLWVGPKLVDWDSYSDIRRELSSCPHLHLWILLFKNISFSDSSVDTHTPYGFCEMIPISSLGLRAPPQRVL